MSNGRLEKNPKKRENTVGRGVRLRFLFSTQRVNVTARPVRPTRWTPRDRDWDRAEKKRFRNQHTLEPSEPEPIRNLHLNIYKAGTGTYIFVF